MQSSPISTIATSCKNYNDVVFIDTGFTPFYLNMDSHLTTPVSFLSGGKHQGSSNEVVKVTLEWMKTTWAKAHTNLEGVEHRMTHVENRSRR